MKRLLFTAIHPAPYIDQWIWELRKYYDIEIAYNYKKSAAKTWQSYSPISGKIIKEYGLVGWTKQIIKNDVILLNGWNKPYNIYTLFIAFLIRKEILVFSDYPTEVIKYSLKWFLKKCFLFLFVPRILCATQSTQKYYQRIFSYKKKNTIFFPYATIAAPDLTDFNTNRSHSLMQGDKIRIFVANNFRARKGYNVLTDSLLLLSKKELSEIDLIIAGSGELFDEYCSKLKEIKSDIKFLGWIENDTYSEYLEKTDIFIHASIFEPFGIPPVDALKYGKLLIVSDGVKSTDEIIVDGVNGYIFKAGNAKELALKIKEAVKNRRNLYKMAAKGKEDACKVYNNECYRKIIM